jgi:serine/threonine protein kinase
LTRPPQSVLNQEGWTLLSVLQENERGGVYKVQAPQGNLAIKVLINSRSARMEYEFQTSLWRAGFNTAQPIKIIEMRSGACIASEFLVGESIGHLIDDFNCDTYATSSLELMNELHSFASSPPIRVYLDTLCNSGRTISNFEYSLKSAGLWPNLPKFNYVKSTIENTITNYNKHSILHGDINSSNIIDLGNRKLKLIDFGSIMAGPECVDHARCLLMICYASPSPVKIHDICSKYINYFMEEDVIRIYSWACILVYADIQTMDLLSDSSIVDRNNKAGILQYFLSRVDELR